MKSFVVMTYYHFMHATAMALSLDEKPNLYFAVNYLEVPDSTIQRIRDTEVFNSVVKLDYSGFLKAISIELAKTKNLDMRGIDSIGNAIFEKYLEPYFGEMMAGADTDDEIFIYNDFQFYYYYVSKHFKHIVGVEDGYKVLEQQTRVHKFKGIYTRLIPFANAGYYPKPLWRQPNVDYIISSCEFDDIDEYYRGKIRICDFYDLIEQNRQSFIEALKYVFDVNLSFAGNNVSILIGQPLDRCQYCDAMEYYLFNRKIIDENDGKSLIIKPHPAEVLDFTLFEDKGVTIINKSFPIELLNYCNVLFEKGISFDSTSLNTLKCIKKNERVLDVERPSLREIRDAVQRSIEGQVVTICVVVKVSAMGLVDYVNAHSYYTINKKLRYEVIIAIDQGLPDAAEEFFSITNMNRNVKKYLSSSDKKSSAWSIELGKLAKGRVRLKENTKTHVIRTSLEEEGLLRYASKCVPNADYYLCTDSTNLGLMVVDNLGALLKKRMRHIVAFPTYSNLDGGKQILDIRNVENLMCRADNTLLHRTVLIEALDKGELEFSLTETMLRHMENVSSEHRMHLSDSTTILLDDSISPAFFLDRADSGARYAKSIDDDCLREEFLLRMYSSVVDEYVSWLKLTSRNYEKTMGLRFIDDLGVDSEMKARIAFSISDALYIYRGREYARFLYKNAAHLTYYQKVESWLLRTEAAKHLEMMRRLKRKARNKVKAMKKRLND